jgi:predicted DCC family thiol-disulfide oxidoreductase YuxK
MISQRRAQQGTTAWAAVGQKLMAGRPSLLERRVRVVAGRVVNEVHAALYENEWRWERFYPV